MRFAWVVVCLLAAVVGGGCGGDEMSMDEYVEQLNTLVDEAIEGYETIVATPEGAILVADAAQLTEFTPQDLQTAIERTTEMQLDIKAAGLALEAPEQVADLHELMFTFDFIAIDQALAARAGTAANWDELSESPEMAAYRTQVAMDKQACADLQAELNARADGDGFAIEAWLSAELKQTIDALFGCEAFPEHPEDVYLPLPNP